MYVVSLSRHFFLLLPWVFSRQDVLSPIDPTTWVLDRLLRGLDIIGAESKAETSIRLHLTGDLRRLRPAMTQCWETTRSARLLSLLTFIVVANVDAVLPTPQSNVEDWKRMKTPTFACHPLDSLHIILKKIEAEEEGAGGKLSIISTNQSHHKKLGYW